MEHWEKKANGWVFISHSSKDYEDVKIVRNYLEENGFSALMFYLKSLEGTSSEKMKLAQELIKWEIEARNIFVLCNSISAKKSKWVQDEINYIKSFPEKNYIELDIEKLTYEKCTQLSKLDRLMIRATLFFSYSYRDKEIVHKIRNYLTSSGFRTWIDSNDLKAGDNLAKKINSAIREASRMGIILVFLSEHSLESSWVQQEFKSAINLNAPIIPIIIDKNLNIELLSSELITLQVLDISRGDFNDNMQKLLQAIKRLK